MKPLRGVVNALTHEPPRWVFHGVMAVAMAGFLYAVSFPGIAFFLAGGTTLVLLAVAILWLVKVLGYWSGRRRGEEGSHGLRLLVAPLCGAILVISVWMDAPLRTRWAVSRTAFENLVKEVDSGRGGTERVPYGRIGLYQISHIDPVEGGILFYEETGNLFDDAGFAYLPQGPSPSLANGSFENPQWRALGNDWYAWTASW